MELPGLASLPDFLDLLNIMGTAVFALTGAISAARKRFDLFGMIFFAALVGVGGGTLRDVILGRLPVFWVTAPINIAVTTVVAVLAFFLMRWLIRDRAIFLWADAIGLATFAIVGTAVALEVGVSPYLAPFFGVITGCFGGMIRDVVANEAPTLLYAELYATAAFAGGLVYVLALQTDWPHVANAAALVGLITGLAVRSLGIIWRLHLPRAKVEGP
jgi:uncharacterized membrane protein YeiH